MGDLPEDWFEEQLKPEHWQEDLRLRTPTLNVRLLADKVLYLSGAALREGFSVETTQALMYFLAEHLDLPSLMANTLWADEQILSRNTFEAKLQSDRTLYVTGVAPVEGFSPEDTLALARFLFERIDLPPKEPPYTFEGFSPTRVI